MANQSRTTYLRGALFATALTAITALGVAPALAADTDADGIDAGDNCPSTFNPLQADVNGDGIGDACNTAGAAGTDTDRDGVADPVDNCATTPNVDRLDCNGNGVGDMCEAAWANRDDDRDGVCNAADACPVEAGGSCGMQAITVPWVPANPTIPHVSYSGATHTLKGIARYGGNQYMWDFGDGTPATAWTAIANPYNLGVNHVYTGAVGQLFIATLSVRNSASPNTVVTATYRVKLSDSGALPAASPYNMDPNKMDVRIDMAIDQGLWWLHTNMTRGAFADGSPGYAQPWGNWSGDYAGNCVALDAFLLHGSKPNKDYATDPYVESVQRSLNYILATSTGSGTIANQVHAGVTDRPDYNLNGVGVFIGPNDGEQTYRGGICGVAFASTGTPNRQSLVGVNTNIRGRTYKEIAQDMVEFFAWGQTDSGTYRGGWQYTPNSGGADGSTNQWPLLAMAAAEDNMAVTTPRFVRSEAPYFMTYSRHTGLDNRNGGWGYQTGTDVYVNHAKTAAGMLYHYFEGNSTSHPEVKAALGYLYRYWSSQNYDGGGAWNVGIGNSYAMYGIMKAMRKPQPNILRVVEYNYNTNQQTANSFDWYYTPPGQSQVGLATDLVRRQAAAGNWSDTIGNNAMSGAFATGWDVLILSKGVTTIPPQAAICDCSFTWDNNQNITLSGACSTHPDLNRTIVSYDWDFNYVNNTFDVDGSGQTVVKVGGYQTYGLHPVALRVTDDNPIALGGPQTSIATCNVETKPPNNCPHPSAGGPYLEFHSQAFQLDASASFDPDGDDLSYAWDLDNDGQFDDAVGVSPTTTFTTTGTFSIGVRVTDVRNDGGATQPCSRTAFSTVEIGNHAPVSNPGGPYEGRPGQTVALDGSASFDPDGDQLTYGWDLNNDGTFTDSASATPNFVIPANAIVGTVYAVCLKVADPFARTDTKCTTVTVKKLNSAPTCSLPAPAIVAECTGGVVNVTVDGSGSSDADADPLSYTWTTNCPAGAFTTPNAAMSTLSLDSAGQACTVGCTATLTVSDGQASTTCSRGIEIVDRTDPSFNATPGNLSLECGATNQAAVEDWLASAGATDSCTSASLANDFVGLTNGCGGATGSTTVTWTATDTCGNDTQVSAQLSITDTTGPDISCPAPVTYECTAPQTAVNLAAMATDSCFGNLIPSGPTSAVYPVGSRSVSFTATDSCGNATSCDSSVTITDTTDPSISCPAPVVAECNANHAAIGVDAGTATGADLCGPAAITGGAAPGFVFPLGTTNVTQTATDASGNDASCTSTVTVQDSTDPLINCPASVTAECNAQGSATGVSAGAATATDVCTNVTVTDPAVGTYALGTTATTHTAIDESGNDATCSNDVTVVDTTAPALICPANVVVECNAQGSATNVSAGNATATDVCTTATVTDPAVGTYPLGTTTTTHGAVDLDGNSASCTNTVTVRDTTGPVFDPASLGTRTVLGNCAGTPVSFALPTAGDVCQGTVVTCATLSGSSVGANTVVCTATDTSGNTTTANLTVNVLAPLRIAFHQPLSDDNVADDPATDADAANQFKAGSTVPHQVKVYACNGTEVTSQIAGQVTLRLTETYRTGVGNGQVVIVPEYSGVGDAGGVLVHNGSFFKYNLNTNTTQYPAGSVNTAAYFSSLITATWNSAPAIIAGREDARLESK